MDLTANPNALWVVTDVQVDIKIAPGSVPKTFEDLGEFSCATNSFLIENDATYANYILFDSEGNAEYSLEYVFDFFKNKC
jgi:hypothetical protein